MTTHARRLAIGLATLTLGIWTMAASNAADDKGLTIPKDLYPKLVEQALKNAQEAVDDLSAKKLSGDNKKYTVRKARNGLAMIAMYTQLTPDVDAQERATLRDAALKVIKTLDDDNYAAAKKQVAGLTGLKPDPKAKPGPVKFLNNFEWTEDVMQHFRLAKDKGMEIEAKLLKLALAADKNKKMIPAKDMNEAFVIMLYQTAIAGAMAKEIKANKKPKTWQTDADEMNVAVADLIDAVNKKDGKTGFQALNKLNSSCNKCHTDFGVR